MSAKEGWNIISRGYQEKTRISLEDVHYGPISPGESELKLLGDVKGKDVLEIGCGGGQNTVVLAKWGARSVGLDISGEQIKFARKLAWNDSVDVSFHVGDMEDLSMFNNQSFDSPLIVCHRIFAESETSISRGLQGINEKWFVCFLCYSSSSF